MLLYLESKKFAGLNLIYHSYTPGSVVALIIQFMQFIQIIFIILNINSNFDIFIVNDIMTIFSDPAHYLYGYDVWLVIVLILLAILVICIFGSIVILKMHPGLIKDNCRISIMLSCIFYYSSTILFIPIISIQFVYYRFFWNNLKL